MRRLNRSIRVFVALVPFVIAFLRDRRRFILIGRGARRSPRHHQRRAERLTRRIAQLGPTFIKLAQIFSSRADIFPEPYLTEIGTLQDQVPPQDAEAILGVILEEYGRPVDEVFDDFSREPLAAASLGQVHRARLGDEEVVVKVLRPGVEEVVALDLDISFRVLFWLNLLFPNHHVRALTAVVREFSHKVRQEMDFRREAENIHHVQETYRDLERIRTPRVFDSHTRRRVLVMEYCRGTKIDRLQEAFDEGRLSFRDTMRTVTGVYLRMMMVDGFLHADPHPGNLLVEDDGTVVLLDWGMVVEVPRWTRETILNVALAVAREDLDGIINGMYQLGMISPEVSRGEIREAAIEIMRIVDRAQGTGRERVQELVQEMFDTFYTWPLILPQELVYFFRAAVLLEGIGFRYDEAFNGLHFIRDVVADFRSDILRTTGREPSALARNVIDEAQNTLRSIRDLVGRAEREELRVRVHPRDIQQQERFLHLQARRILLSIFATATAVISSILFISIRSWWLLAGGLIASLFLFVLVFFLPTHLLENPLRHARGIRPGDPHR
ncbi:AarF/UbiB family protein [Gaopeijia maritima]|uniref:ABC1 kinase family protein n=1 Tax=Gaopeijia maritima TaxID=3119007 RepID=UPI00324E00C7